MKQRTRFIPASIETIFFLAALMVLLAANASAGPCDEHALLRDAPPERQYKWSNIQPGIRVWESPDMIRVVGTIKLGEVVKVVSKARGFVRITGTEEDRAESGWVSERQVDHYAPGPEGEGCWEAGARGAANYRETH